MSTTPADAKPLDRPRALFGELLTRDQCAGLVVFGAAALALGVLGLITGDFTAGFHPVPETTPARTPLAYAGAGLFCLAGLGLWRGRTRRPAAWILGLLYLAFALCWARRVLAFPLLIGTWLGTAEQLLLAVGAMAAAGAGRDWRTLARLGQYAFGACEIIFGLAHFMSLPETIAMTPAWLPLGQRFWALATGAAHLAAGAALLIGFLPVITTRLMALMFAVFGALVWLPVLWDDPTSRFAWGGNAINLALIGAALTIGDRLAAKERSSPASGAIAAHATPI